MFVNELIYRRQKGRLWTLAFALEKADEFAHGLLLRGAERIDQLGHVLPCCHNSPPIMAHASPSPIPTSFAHFRYTWAVMIWEPSPSFIQSTNVWRFMQRL